MFYFNAGFFESAWYSGEIPKFLYHLPFKCFRPTFCHRLIHPQSVSNGHGSQSVVNFTLLPFVFYIMAFCFAARGHIVRCGVSGKAKLPGAGASYWNLTQECTLTVTSKPQDSILQSSLPYTLAWFLVEKLLYILKTLRENWGLQGHFHLKSSRLRLLRCYSTVRLGGWVFFRML